MNHFFTPKSTVCLLLLAGMAILLSACGQYGDLYLPEDASAGQPPPQQVGEPQEPDEDQEQELEQPQDQ